VKLLHFYLQIIGKRGQSFILTAEKNQRERPCRYTAETRDEFAPPDRLPGRGSIIRCSNRRRGFYNVHQSEIGGSCPARIVAS
jgi:hypothetical protein